VQAYEGLQTADRLQEQYVFIPQKVRDVYLYHLLINNIASLQQLQQQTPAAASSTAGSNSSNSSKARSAIIFVSTCRGCHMLSLVMRELGVPAAALHSGKAHSKDGSSFPDSLRGCKGLEGFRVSRRI
jgi:ATP-dependent RNA helicase DDX49/DBP8